MSLLPKFSSRNIMVPGLIFKSLVYFECIFVCGVKQWFKFILLHAVVQFFQYHLLKRFFPIVYFRSFTVLLPLFNVFDIMFYVFLFCVSPTNLLQLQLILLLFFFKLITSYLRSSTFTIFFFAIEIFFFPILFLFLVMVFPFWLKDDSLTVLIRLVQW